MAKKPIITSGLELWNELLEANLIQPNSHDSDLNELLLDRMKPAPTVEEGLQLHNYSASDLINCFDEPFSAFHRLLSDLLALYGRIGAKYASSDNLEIRYEFAPGEFTHLNLEDFRIAKRLIREALSGSLKFPDEVGSFWSIIRDLGRPKSPELSASYSSEVLQRKASSADTPLEEFKAALPDYPHTDDDEVQLRIRRVQDVTDSMINLLLSYGETYFEASNHCRHIGDNLGSDCVVCRCASIFSDRGVETANFAVRYLVDKLNRGLLNKQDVLQHLDRWLDSWWEPAPSEYALQDILSLPMWGKRHELYSAWVLCLIDSALSPFSPEYEIKSNRLDFPFKPRKILTFQDAVGQTELWSELRTCAAGELTDGRKFGIQPDYRFIRYPAGRRRGLQAAKSNTVFAIEVKHYLRAAGARHGRTARDYIKNLPNADLCFVAQGPIGKTSINYVPEESKHRVKFFENCNGSSSASANLFKERLRECFQLPNYLCLSWRPTVNSLELDGLAEVNRYQLPRDIVDDYVCVLPQGNLSRWYIVPSQLPPRVQVRVACHPDRAHGILDAAPICVFRGPDGQITTLVPNPDLPRGVRHWNFWSIE